MFVILPVICFIFLYFFFRNQLESEGLQSWREPFLLAAMVWGTLIVASTEFLSLFRLLYFEWVLGFWIFVSLFSGLLCFYSFICRKQKAFSNAFDGIPGFYFVLMLAMVPIIVAVGFIALNVPPNNDDAMAYHMSRVVHWIQNRSVAHYPTHTLRQLFSSPWSEFAITHFQILSYSDRFANGVQWFSMLGSLLGVSLIAKEFGADRKAQMLAAVFCSTIPMGILQASSTQTDYVVTFWLVCFVYFFLKSKQQLKVTDQLCLGVSLGLAILTKPLAYFYGFPFFLWLGLKQYQFLSLKSWKPVLIILLFVLLINSGHYARNIDLTGYPIGREFHFLLNESVEVPLLISNIIRNLAVHLGTPWQQFNSMTEAFIQTIHRYINFDLNEPKATFLNLKFHITQNSFHEDFAGNPIHLALIVFCTVIFFMTGKFKKSRDLLKYATSVFFGFLILCLIVKWQPWISRFHLPLFVLSSPFVGIVLSRGQPFGIKKAVPIILLLLSIPYILINQKKPWVGEENIFVADRTRLYFRDPILQDPNLQDSYTQAADYLKSQNCSDLGLYMESRYNFEYPLWVIFRQRGMNVKMVHINVQNISKVKYTAYPFNTFKPCAVIAMTQNSEDQIQISENVFIKRWTSFPITIYTKI